MRKVLNIIEYGSLVIVIIGLVLRFTSYSLLGTVIILSGIFLRILWYILVKMAKVDFSKKEKEYREDILDDID
jgi:hypothetical protein